MSLIEILAAVFGGFIVLLLLSFVLKVPTNDPDGDDTEDEEEDGEHVEYDPAGPDPWEAELGETEPLRDVDTLVAVLRQGEPGPCRQAIQDLVAHGAGALPALRAAAAEDDPDLRIDAERAIGLIEEETGS